MANFCLLVGVLLVICDVSFGGFFTIVGPQTAFVDSDYRLQLTAEGYNEPTNLKITIATIKRIVIEQTIPLSNNVDEQISFKVLNFANQTFFIRAKLVLPDSPENVFEQKVKIIDKKFSVFIQTDKKNYKPGDLVRFRVLVLDADTKPYQYNQISVVFTDGNRIKLTEKRYNNSDTGFVEDSLQLADELNFGTWGIHVMIDNSSNIAKQNFAVIDYQLPPFEVSIEPNAKHLVLSENQIKVKVSAKYDFGSGQQKVKGKATVEAKTYDPRDENKPLKVVSRKADTKGEVTFNMQRELKIQPNLAQTFVKLTATFVDDLTGRSSSAETFVTVHKTRNYKFEIIAEKEFITPGKQYKIQALIRDFDGSVLRSNREKVLFKFHKQSVVNSCSTSDDRLNMKWTEMLELEKEILPRNGIAEITVDVPEDALTLTIGMRYKTSYHVHKAFRMATKSRENLELTVIKASTNDNQISVKIDATHEMTNVYSIVIGKTGIVDNKRHNAGGENNLVMNFKATPAMLPSSNLIVYYFQSTGEIIFNQIKLEFDNKLANFLKIQLESDAKPGETTRITLETTQNSVVGLLAVDQRVTFNERGNDIDAARVRNETNSFYFRNVFDESNKKNLLSLLARSNAFVITNAVGGQPSCTSSRFGDDGNENVSSDDDLTSNQTYNAETPQESSTKVSETWLFESFKIGPNGKQVFTPKVPDFLTSYVITGFSLHSEHGLGLAEQKNLRVSKEFFVELDLPKSLFKGEVLRVRAFVYNFMKNSNALTSNVVLSFDEGDFELVESIRAGVACSYKSTYQTRKNVQLPRDGAVEANFLVRPLKEGLLTLKIVASTALSRDEMTKQIVVEHSEFKKSKSKHKLFDLRNNKFDSYYFDMNPDNEAIKSTVQTEIHVVGDLMGPALENVEELFDVPVVTTGHKLSALMPTILALKYLKNINNLSADTKLKGIKALETVYQYIVSKKFTGKNFGAYSQWNDDQPDIETTAFVAKFLSVAKDWIEIDDGNTLDALGFLTKKQDRDGKFTNLQLSQEASESDVKEHVVLTATTVISFLENERYVERFKTTINKALNYIDNKFNEINDNRVLAVSAYALALGKPEAASKFIDKLTDKAEDVEEKAFWDGNESKVQTAGYAILALIQLGRTLEAKNILNFLLSKRLESGGFSSPQDTVIGLQAIAEMGKHLYSSNFRMNVYFMYEPNLLTGVFINDKNAMEVQKLTVPSFEGISVQTNGTGVAYVQLWQKYFVKSFENSTSKFDIAVTSKLTGRKLNLSICVKLNLNHRESKLTVAEISLPNGFALDVESIRVQENQKFQTRDGKTVLNVFFEKIESNRKTCVNLRASRWYDVTTTMPYPVKVYEHEDKENFSIEYYKVPQGDQCIA